MNAVAWSHRARAAVVGAAAAALIAGGLAACGTNQSAGTVGSSAGVAAAVGKIQPVTFTAAQTAKLKSLTDSPEKVSSVVDTLNASFGKALTATTTREVTSPSKAAAASYVVEPALAYGYNGHFWVTASYADMASGFIWSGVRYCSTRLPGWLCSYLGNVLTSWSNGWGWAGNHGVWGAVYWNGINGGRW